MSSFGSEILRIRKERGYSQKKFAQLLDSTQSAISSWEREFRIPPVATIKKVANILNVPLYSLMPQGESVHTDEAGYEITEALQSNPELRALFDKAKYMSPENLRVLQNVASAISKDRTDNV